MDTILKTPEMVICAQGVDVSADPEEDAMYFIAKGTCKVMVKDKFTDRSETHDARIIDEGCHFGEISMVYGCPRSATVTSIYYLQCAKITRVNYEELLLIYPVLNDLARQAILSYDDPLKVFLEMSLNNVEYFDKFPKIVKNEWIFTMKHRTYERGKFICRVGESANEMLVIQSGEV